MEGDSESSQVLLDQYMGLNSLAEFIVKKRNLPENTVHEPAFLESLSSLSKQSLNLLSSSLSQFKTKRDSLNRKIEDFSSTNYSVFLNKAEANKAVLDGCEVIKSSNDLLLSKVPDLASSVEVFMQNSFDLIRNSKLNMIALRKHTQILELLELPQLIETFLLNGYFDDALLIYAHAEKIKKKQTGRSPLIHLIANQVQRVGNQLLSYLCRQLSMPISLSSCLKTIVYLRRMNIFNEQELRLKFLQARSICLNDRLTAALYQNTYSPQLDFERPRSSSTNINCDKSNSGDIVELNEFKNGQSNFLDSSSSKSFIKTDRAHYEVYFRATHRIEVTRLQLFDIVTQYRAVFADDEGLLAGHISDKNCSTPPLSIWHPLFVDYSPSSHLYPVSESLFLPTPGHFHDGLSALSESSLFQSWLTRQIGVFLAGLGADIDAILRIPSITEHSADRFLSASYDNLSASSAATLINDVGMAGSEGPQSDIVSAFSRVQILQTQAAYFAASFARIGCDFRPHLSDLFASAILRTVQTVFTNALVEYSFALETLPWRIDMHGEENMYGKSSSTQDLEAERELEIVPPYALINYPALALLCNRVLELFNGMRIYLPGNIHVRLLHKLVNLLYQASYRLSLSYRTALDLRPVNWRVDAFSTADTFLHTLVPHLLIGLIHLFTPSAVTFAYSSSLASRLAPPVGTSSNDTSDTLSKSIPPLSNDHLPISDMKHLIQLICQPLYVYWPNLSLHNQLPPSQAANFSHTPLDTLQPSDTSALDATHSFSVQRLLPRQQSLQSLDANSSSLQERNSSSPQASTSIPD